MTPNQRAILASIIRNPDDDGLRGMFADACEEAGDDETARVIRSTSTTPVKCWDCAQRSAVQGPEKSAAMVRRKMRSDSSFCGSRLRGALGLPSRNGSL